MSRVGKIFLITVVIGIMAIGQYAAAEQVKEGKMNSSQIQVLIEAGDWTAVDLAEQLGPAAVSQIEPYIKHENYNIRLLAVDCLVVAGGPEAAAALIEALSDDNEKVAVNAASGLHENLPVGQEKKLLKAWDQAWSPYVRREIALVLGRLDNPILVSKLNDRLPGTTADVRDSLIAALSKLGDDKARQLFAEELKTARGERIAILIEYVQYINDPWVLPLLRPVLERTEIAVDLSTHRTTLKRRGVDLAVDEVLKISGVKFSFGLNPLGQYSDAQVVEVIRYVEQL
jgi:hypothetical protein